MLFASIAIAAVISGQITSRTDPRLVPDDIAAIRAAIAYSVTGGRTDATYETGDLYRSRQRLFVCGYMSVGTIRQRYVYVPDRPGVSSREFKYRDDVDSMFNAIWESYCVPSEKLGSLF